MANTFSGVSYSNNISDYKFVIIQHGLCLQCYNVIVSRGLNIFIRRIIMKKTFIIVITGILAAMTGCGTSSGNTVPTKAAVTTTTAATASENTSTTAAKADNKKAENSEGITTAASDENTGASPVTKTDYMQIAGVWYEENVLDTRALIIDGDGTYRLAYRGGGSEYGNIEIERQVLGADDVVNIWYCFYRADGTLWESFRLTARENMSPALVSGFDSSSSVFGLADGDATGEPDATLAAVKRFMGNWSYGRCYISISNNGAAEGSIWTYICTYDAENDALVCNGTGVNVDYVYTEDGQSSYTENYNNGSAMFYTDDNANLLWHDYNANVADGMLFTSC